MPQTPKKQPPPKKSQPKTTDPIPPSTSSRPSNMREQLKAIREKFEECTSSYVEYCENKKGGPTDLDDRLQEHKRQVEIFADFFKNLEPPSDMREHIYERELRQIRKPAKKVRTVSGPDDMQSGCRRRGNSRNLTNMACNDNNTRTKKMKQIIKEGEGILHKLQIKGKDSQIKLNQKTNSSNPSLVDANQSTFACTAAEESTFSVTPQNLENTGAKSKTTHTESDIKLKLNIASLDGTVDEDKLVYTGSAGAVGRLAPIFNLAKSYTQSKSGCTKLDMKQNQRRNSYPLTVDESYSFCTDPLPDRFSQNVLRPNSEKGSAKPKSTKTTAALKSTHNKTSCEIDVDSNKLDSPVGDQILSTPALNFELNASKLKSTKTKTGRKSNQSRADSEANFYNNKLDCSSTVNTRPCNPTPNLEKNGAKPKFTKTKADLELNQGEPTSEVVGNNKFACPPTANTRPSTPASSMAKNGANPKSPKTKADLKSNRNRADSEVMVNNNKLAGSSKVNPRTSTPTSNLEKIGAKPKFTNTKTGLEPNQKKLSSEVIGSSKFVCSPSGNIRPSTPASNLEKNGAKPKLTKIKTNLESNQDKLSSEVIGTSKFACSPSGNIRPYTSASNLENNGAKPKFTKTKLDLKSNRIRADSEVAVNNNKVACTPKGKNIRLSTAASNSEKNNAKAKSTTTKVVLKSNENIVDSEVAVNNHKLACSPTVNTKLSNSTSNLEKNDAKSKSTKTKVVLKSNANIIDREVAIKNYKLAYPPTVNTKPSNSTSNLEKNDAKAKSTKTKVVLKSNDYIIDREVAIKNYKLAYPPTLITKPFNSTSNLEKNDAKAKSTKTKADLQPNKNKTNFEVADDTSKLACPSIEHSRHSGPTLNPDKVSGSIKVDQNRIWPVPIANLQKPIAKLKSDLNSGSTTVGVGENQPIFIPRLPNSDLGLKSSSDLRQMIKGISEALHHSQAKQIKLDPKSNSTKANLAVAADVNQPFYRPTPSRDSIPKLAQMKANSKKGNPVIDVDGDKPVRPATPFPHMFTNGIPPKATRTKSDSESSSEELSRCNFDHEAAVNKKYPIRPPTPGPNVQRTVVKPKATSLAELPSSKPRRVKTVKHLTEHERRKREQLINTRNCSYCNRIHPLDPHYYVVDLQYDVLDMEVPGLEFPYLDQHLEDCKQEKRNNEIPIDESKPDMNKTEFNQVEMNTSAFSNESFVEVSDGETLSCGHSEAEIDVLDDADEDVAVTVQGAGEKCDDLPKDSQQPEPKQIQMSGSENPEPAPAASTSPCKHTTGIPDWIDYCPFCDYDSPEHAGTVLPDFCKIKLDQTTCEISPLQIINTIGRQRSHASNVNTIVKQKICPTQQKSNGKVKVCNKKQNVDAQNGNKRSSNAQIFANILDTNLTHVGNEDNCYVKQSWLLSQPSVAFYITEEEVEKKIKSLRKSHIHWWDNSAWEFDSSYTVSDKKISLMQIETIAEEWEEVFYGRVSQTFPLKSNRKKWQLCSMSSWIESEEYYKLCKPDF